MDDGPPILLIAGDTHGHFDLLDEHIAAAVRTHKKIDAVIAVGDFLTAGDGVPLPNPAPSFDVPVWFIGGNHEPWLALDDLGARELGPGLTYLGRVGIQNIAGLQVGFLSAVYGPTVSEQPARSRQSFKERTYWAREELELLVEAAAARPVDLLVTHEWPAGFAKDRYGVAVGNDDLARLSLALRPTLHVCGHMHLRRSGSLGAVRVEAAGYIPDGVTGSFVAPWREDGVGIEDPWREPLTPDTFVRMRAALKGRSARRFAARTSRVPISDPA